MWAARRTRREPCPRTCRRLPSLRAPPAPPPSKCPTSGCNYIMMTRVSRSSVRKTCSAWNRVSGQCTRPRGGRHAMSAARPTWTGSAGCGGPRASPAAAASAAEPPVPPPARRQRIPPIVSTTAGTPVPSPVCPVDVNPYTLPQLQQIFRQSDKQAAHVILDWTDLLCQLG